jgi:hypothetical protein
MWGALHRVQRLVGRSRPSWAWSFASPPRVPHNSRLKNALLVRPRR